MDRKEAHTLMLVIADIEQICVNLRGLMCTGSLLQGQTVRPDITLEMVRTAAEQIAVMTDKVTTISAMTAASHEGFRQFVNDEGHEYGSFEVFHRIHGTDGEGQPIDEGWYWWSRYPGCLPDSGLTGFFGTSVEAYNDAQGE